LIEPSRRFLWKKSCDGNAISKLRAGGKNRRRDIPAARDQLFASFDKWRMLVQVGSRICRGRLGPFLNRYCANGSACREGYR
jgi:hypothetical protein